MSSGNKHKKYIWPVAIGILLGILLGFLTPLLPHGNELRIWIGSLLGLVFVAGAVWYFTGKSSREK